MHDDEQLDILKANVSLAINQNGIEQYVWVGKYPKWSCKQLWCSCPHHWQVLCPESNQNTDNWKEQAKRTSFLKKTSQRVTTKQIMLQKRRYPLNVRWGTPHLWLKKKSETFPVQTHSTYAKASLLKARNTVNDAKNPVFRPMVWQVDAYDRQSCERRVKAQPEDKLAAKTCCTRHHTIYSDIWEHKPKHHSRRVQLA